MLLMIQGEVAGDCRLFGNVLDYHAACHDLSSPPDSYVLANHGRAPYPGSILDDGSSCYDTISRNGAVAPDLSFMTNCCSYPDNAEIIYDSEGTLMNGFNNGCTA